MSVFVGRPSLNSRLGEWRRSADAIEKRFEEVALEEQEVYFERLRAFRDDAHRTVQLLTGIHVADKLSDISFVSEGGASLVISQDTTYGYVAILLYPYELSTDVGSEQPLLWGLFDSPADITPERLAMIIQSFARYCRVSSLVDKSGYRSDRLHVKWLRCRSIWLRFRGRLPFRPALIRTRRSFPAKAWSIFATVLVGIAWVLNVPSQLATLVGTSVPQLWVSFHQAAAKPSAPSTVAVAPVLISEPIAAPTAVAKTLSTSPEAASEPSMSVISGWYTFCPKTSQPEADSKLLNFLYDVQQNAGKTAFFDVQIDIDCVMGGQRAPTDDRDPFARRVNGTAVEYGYHLPAVGRSDVARARRWLSGNRDLGMVHDLYSDNGSYIVVHEDADNRNAFSKLSLENEGADDIIFGPYSIKASTNDENLTYDLSAPTLDTRAEVKARKISQELKQGHLKDLAPISQSIPGK